VSTPRLSPLARGEWTDEDRALLRGSLPAADRYLSGDPDAPPLPNILGLFGLHPTLAGGWLGWNAGLLEAVSLAPRLRELVILRVAWRTQCRYEWAQHETMARDAGLNAAELAAVAGPADTWPAPERDLLDAADQMIEAHRVSGDTWRQLADRYGDRELLELLFLVGSYCALALVLNSVDLPPDGGPDDEIPTMPALEDRP
jgi:AhpD family alkylhydroperoxidase